MTNDDAAPLDENSFLLGVGSLAVMTMLANREANSDRQNKMKTVAADFAQALEQVNPNRLPRKLDAKSLIELLPTATEDRWSMKERVVFVLELASTNPFAPHTLNYKDDDFNEALVSICYRLGVYRPRLDWIRRWQKSAAKSHKHVDWTRAALVGVGAAVLMGATAGWAAPIIAPAFAAAGLSGAAAILSGLAAIGFGSLASGGLGIAGGMWILTGAGAALAGSVVGGATLLGAFDSSTAIAEIIKAQVAFKVLYIDGLADASDGTPGAAQDAMRRQRDEAERLKRDALGRNEDDAPAVKNVAAVIDALTDAIKWMNKRVEEAPSERFEG